MSARPRVLVLHAPGTNRDRETALACQLAGGEPEIVHINQLLSGEFAFHLAPNPAMCEAGRQPGQLRAGRSDQSRVSVARQSMHRRTSSDLVHRCDPTNSGLPHSQTWR